LLSTGWFQEQIRV